VRAVPPLHRFSRLVGSARIGSDWFERAGLACAGERPRGLCDRLEELLPPGAGAIPPSVRAFFEDPAALTLEVTSTWQWLPGLCWRVGARVMAAIGQLCLPHHRATVSARMVRLDGAREGRADARGIVRTRDDEGGAVFQVFAYGVTAGLMSVAIPLPRGHLAGLLRLRVEGPAVILTTARGDGEARTGVWWVTPWASLRTPFEETLRFADDGGAPGAFTATHEQRCGRWLLVTHAYRFAPRAGGLRAAPW